MFDRDHALSSRSCGMGTFMLVALLGVACSSTPAATESEPSARTTSKLDASKRKVRSTQIKAAASSRGVTNALLVAGIAYHESGLAQCWSEATWSCPGPWSGECGGPVLTGAGDGPCSWQQGGIGMFQLDSGTYSQTLTQHGNQILDVAGNVAAGTDFILYKVKVCPNTPSFANDEAVVDWVNSATPGTDRYETFMTAMAWCYNGCAPTFTGCSHSAVRAKYKNATESLLNEFGWGYWYAPAEPEPDPAPVPSSLELPTGRVASNTDGRLEVFVRGGDDAVWHAYQTAPNNGFNAFESLGGSAGSDPVVGRNADGRLEVFAVDPDNVLRHRWQTSSGWSRGWLAADGEAIAGQPAVASNADGRLEVFARSMGGQVVHRWQLEPNGGWSGWNGTGGMAADAPALARNADGRLEVFVRGTDDAIWHFWQGAPSSAFGAWSSLGGVLAGAPRVARDGSGHLIVVARGPDARIWWRAQETSGWTAWAAVSGGTIDADPEVGVNADGRIEIFAKSGTAIVHSWESASSAHDFGALSSLGGTVSSKPALGRSIDGRLELFARATDGSIAHVWQLPESGWSTWGSLGGWTPSF